MLKIIQKIIWWFAGADYKLLSQTTSSWQKYYNLGLTNITSSLISLFLAFEAITTISGNIFLSSILAVIWGLIVVIINNILFEINAFPSERKYDTKTLLVTFLRVLMALEVSSFFVKIIEIKLFSEHILLSHSSAVLSTQTSTLLEKIEALERFKQNNTIYTISWLIQILFTSIEVFPLIISMLSQKGEYEHILEITYHENRKRLELESNIRNELHEREQMQIRDKYIESLEDKETEQQDIPDEVSNNIEEVEFYIKYKSLPVEELKLFFESLNDLYIEAYMIITGYVYLDVRGFDIMKTHPEDVLVFGSITTGNSITFRVKTGWKPKFDVKDGDIQIALPKGAVTLIGVIYILKTMFEFGTSQVKELMEIRKLDVETQYLSHQDLELLMRLQNASDTTRANFQKKLTQFYNVSIANENFKQLTISNDFKQQYLLDPKTQKIKKK